MSSMNTMSRVIRNGRHIGMQGGKLAAQYDKESKGKRNLAFKPVSHNLRLLHTLMQIASYSC